MNHDELKRSDLYIAGSEMEVDRQKEVISAFIDTTQLIDSKYIKTTAANQRQFLSLYADMNPFDLTLKVSFLVENASEDYTEHEYPATEAELDMIKDMMIDAMKAEYGMTPQEFYNCDDFVAPYIYEEEVKLGEQT